MGPRVKIRETQLLDVRVVESETLNDHRGAFRRLFCSHELRVILGERSVVQINQSRTHALGAVRGLHYQRTPYAEMKLVRCLRGRVWDVALDLRAGSPTLLQWHGEELSAENARMLVIPEGCAHGFQVLEPNSELLYLHTMYYTPDAEAGVRFDDPLADIRWPLAAVDLSMRDLQHALLEADFTGLQV